jgi:hypothetical protein
MAAIHDLIAARAVIQQVLLIGTAAQLDKLFDGAC